MLPAQRAVAVAQVAEAQAALDKTVIYAGVDGTMKQFTLRVGDYVNPMIRPAGILIPKGAGRIGLPGRVRADLGTGAEGRHDAPKWPARSKPFIVIPMVITEFQDVISSGQLRQTDLLIDPNQVAQPGIGAGLHGADVPGRDRRHPAGQHLHRQCLYQQLRPAAFRREIEHGAHGSRCMRSTRSGWSMPCCCACRC